MLVLHNVPSIQTEKMCESENVWAPTYLSFSIPPVSLVLFSLGWAWSICYQFLVFVALTSLILQDPVTSHGPVSHNCYLLLSHFPIRAWFFYPKYQNIISLTMPLCFHPASSFKCPFFSFLFSLHLLTFLSLSLSLSLFLLLTGRTVYRRWAT